MNRSDNRFALSALMVIVSAVLWGLYGSFVTVLTSMGLSQNALVFLRMFATSIPVGLLMLATDRSAFRVRPADIPLFIANGVLSLLFFTFCYTSAIKVTKIATAVLPARSRRLRLCFRHRRGTVRRNIRCFGCRVIDHAGRPSARSGRGPWLCAL